MYIRESMKPQGLYILDGEIFRLADTWKEAADFRNDFDNCRIAKDYVIPTMFFVSTVFLMFDHAWGDGSPILFESMIFSDCELNGVQDRYHSYEAALTGHRTMLEFLTLNTHKGYHCKNPAIQQYKDVRHE